VLIQHDQQFKCSNHHSFDVSRQGVLHLVKAQSHKERGDSKLQIEARNLFLNSHAYDAILQSIKEVLTELSFTHLADCACGEGYYTHALAQAFYDQQFYGFDLSKEALKLAKKQKNVQYVIANIKDIPLMDHSVDVVLSMFAPLYLEEVKRILAPSAYLIVVSPATNHLLELKQPLYEHVILNDYKERVDESFIKLKSLRIQDQLTLDHSQLQDLLKMTPYYYTSNKQNLEKVLNQSQLTVQLDVWVELYQRNT
jgi:23S rRNA (guanine745-N1)-methyltransferase